MRRFLGAFAFVITSAHAQQFTMVNAASYTGVAAPDSLATIFGSALAPSTASASLDASGQLPTELAGIRVEIAGTTARLIYVSPGQINLVVPASINAGTEDVAIRTVATNATKTATAQIQSAAPGVFTSDASGAGPGAILNAVTYAPAPFLVQTPGDGSDTRTRLAVYGTGFRNAKNVTATAQDSNGNRYTLAVEYAAAAPGFFGLDQVNVVLPADLDAAGTVSLRFAADSATSNEVTFRMNQLSPAALQLDSITVSPVAVSGGDSATVTVALNGVARSGGMAVFLRSNQSAAQVPGQITVAEGKASTQTTATTLNVPSMVTATITAQASGVSRTAQLEVDPPNAVQLTSITFSTASLVGGRAVTGTINLSTNAPAGGVVVGLASDSDVLKVPATVTVPFGRSSADFAVTIAPLTQPQLVTLSASYGSSGLLAKVRVVPALQLTLDSSSVVGGASVNASVAIADPAPVTGAVVQLQSGDSTIARPPSTVTIGAGQTSASFTLTTTQVSVSRTVTVMASYAGLQQSASLTVNPPAPLTLQSVTIVPDHITGGNTAQGTVTLTGPATVATTVTLTSNSALATVPGLVTIPQNQTTVTFNIGTSRVAAPVNATITASLQGVSKTAVLTVQ